MGIQAGLEMMWACRRKSWRSEGRRESRLSSVLLLLDLSLSLSCTERRFLNSPEYGGGSKTTGWKYPGKENKTKTKAP